MFKNKSFRLLLSVAFVTVLAACGSTSNLKPSNGKSLSNIADYETVYVADFTDKTGAVSKNAEKQAAHAKTVEEATRVFADMIGTNIEKTKSAPNVIREAAAEGKQLRIEGDITTFKRGNALAKMLLPFAGSTKFNAVVRFIDHQTGELIGQIIVDKNSNPLGGGIAATQSTNSFMSGAAEKVAEQLESARNPKVSK